LANNRRSKRKVRDKRKRRKTTFCFAPSASQAALLIQLCHRKCRCGGASSANRPNSVPFSGSLGEEGSGRPFIQLNSNRALSSAVICATRHLSLRVFPYGRAELVVVNSDLEIGTKEQERAGVFSHLRPLRKSWYSSRHRRIQQHRPINPVAPDQRPLVRRHPRPQLCP
jgi:hypothetical protein